MIKTIILDESVVNSFLTSLRMRKGMALVANETLKAESFSKVEEIIMEFLEVAKVKQQTTKTNQSLPYEFEH